MEALRAIVGADVSEQELLSLLKAAGGSAELAANMFFEGKYSKLPLLSPKPNDIYLFISSRFYAQKDYLSYWCKLD